MSKEQVIFKGGCGYESISGGHFEGEITVAPNGLVVTNTMVRDIVRDHSEYSLKKDMTGAGVFFCEEKHYNNNNDPCIKVRTYYGQKHAIIICNDNLDIQAMDYIVAEAEQMQMDLGVLPMGDIAD